MTTPESITWTIHRAAQQPWKAAAALLLIVFALFAVHAVGGSALITMLAAVLLFGSIAEFLLPITYTLDPAGAHSCHLASHRVIAWSQVRRVYLLRNGIKLSPLVSRGVAESYRGVLLQTRDRDAVLTQVHSWLREAGVSPEIVEEQS